MNRPPHAATLLSLCLVLAPVPAVLALGWPGQDLEGRFCPRVTHNYGPYDYTDPRYRKKGLPVVEAYHFTPEIRMLAGLPEKAAALEADIAYTLRSFPNHHLALASMMNLELLGGWKPHPPTICYFNRAEAFRPDDYKVKLLKGIYLRRKKRYEDALVALREAQRLRPDSAEVAYHLGLLYLETGHIRQALEQARKAYAADYPLQGLRKALRRHGHNL